MFLSEHLLFVLIAGILLACAAIERARYSAYRKPLVILVSSALILWMDASSFVFLSLFSSAAFFLVRRGLPVKKHILAIAVFLILTLLVIQNHPFGDASEGAVKLIGISYYFFRIISFLIEYAKEPKQYQAIKPLDYYTYIFFFPLFLAGPIQRYSQFGDAVNEVEDRNRLYFMLFACITVKLVVVDRLLHYYAYSVLYPGFANYPGYSGEWLLLKLYLFGLIAFLHAYMDLMIYTEISKTLSRLLGFKAIDNFNRPLFQSNISSFWRSWHMSLSSWTADYIFMPVLIMTKKSWLAIYASMFTIGMWHGATVNWAVWAFAHGTALTWYGWWRGTRLFKKICAVESGEKAMRALGNLATAGFVSSVFIVVAFKDIAFLMEIVLHIIRHAWRNPA